MAQKNFHSLFGLEMNWVFAGLTLFFSLIFILWQSRQKNLLIPLGLLLLGITSNALDKIRFGFIIDYINLYNIFAFNLADLSIALGTVLLVWRIIKE